MTLSGTGNITTEVSADSTENIGGSQTINIANKLTIDVGKGQSKINMDSSGNITLEGKKQIELKVGENKITITESSVIITAGNGTYLNMTKDSAAILNANTVMSLHSTEGMLINGTTKVEVKAGEVDIN